MGGLESSATHGEIAWTLPFSLGLEEYFRLSDIFELVGGLEHVLFHV